MSGVVVDHSPLESTRFGLRIGRCTLAGAVDVGALAAASDGFDVVVLRYPADALDVPFALASVPGHRTVPADHLCVWEWRGTEPPVVELPPGWTVARSSALVEAADDVDDVDGVDVVEIVDVVRDSFAGYPNHYRANPLLDRDAALDGYCEWAGMLVEGDHDAATVLRDPAGKAVGIALVDWTTDPPDIRLAGMRSSVQGRGLYRVLLGHVIGQELERGGDGVQISTQSHNTKVMRAWASIGFVPVRTIATVHLVRDELVAKPFAAGSP